MDHTNIRLSSIPQPPVLHDSVFATRADTHGHGNHVCPCFFHGSDRPFLNVQAHDDVTMAGIDQEVLRSQAQLFLQLCAHVGQEVVLNSADFGDRHRFHGDEDGRVGTVPQCQ